MKKLIVSLVLSVAVVSLYGCQGAGSELAVSEDVVEAGCLEADCTEGTCTEGTCTEADADIAADDSSLAANTEEKAGEEIAPEDIPWNQIAHVEYTFPVNDGLVIDKDNIITVGYAGECHYSEDGGVTFPDATNESLCRFALSVPETGVVYSCGNGGEVIKSNDGGKNYTKISPFDGTAKSYLASFADCNNGIIGALKVIGLTNDGGNSWKKIELEKNAIALYMESADKFYYVDDAFNLYSTVDGGQSFTKTELKLPEGDDINNKQKNFDMSVDDEGVYIFCYYQQSTKALKCVTTSDFTNYESIPMPKTTGVSYIHLTDNGFTLVDTIHKTIEAYERK